MISVIPDEFTTWLARFLIETLDWVDHHQGCKVWYGFRNWILNLIFSFRRNYKGNLKTRSPESPQNKITDERSSQSEREDNEDSQGENHNQNLILSSNENGAIRGFFSLIILFNSILDIWQGSEYASDSEVFR